MGNNNGNVQAAFNITSIIIALVICFTNILTIVAIWKFKKLKNGTNYLILSLSIADLSLGIVLPVCAGAQLLKVTSAGLCDFCFLFKAVTISTSIATIVAIAIERFFAIVYPLKHRTKKSKRYVFLGIFIIWMYEATIFSIHIFTTSKFNCVVYGISKWLSILNGILTFIYFIVCGYIYIKIYLTAAEHVQRVHGMKLAIFKERLMESQTVEESLKDNRSAEEGKTGNLATVAIKEYDNHGNSNCNLATTPMVNHDNPETQPINTMNENDSDPVANGSEGKCHSKNHSNNFSNQAGNQDNIYCNINGCTGNIHSNIPVNNVHSNNDKKGSHSNTHSNRCQRRSWKKCEDCGNIRVARMTFLVLLVFILCISPYIFVSIVKTVLKIQTQQHWLLLVTVQIVYCNSFMNSLLYSWQNSDFRKAFRTLLC